MSPRFIAALDNFQRLAESFNQPQPLPLRKLVRRSLSDDAEQAAEAIRRIERDHDPALAALLWGMFWVRQGDLAQARRELEPTTVSRTAPSLWGGIVLMMLGEICMEMGENKRGKALIRRAKEILG